MAFIDTQLYIHQMISVKNFILAADVMKSISLLRYQEESKTLSLVSRVRAGPGGCLQGLAHGGAGRVERLCGKEGSARGQEQGSAWYLSHSLTWCWGVLGPHPWLCALSLIPASPAAGCQALGGVQCGLHGGHRPAGLPGYVLLLLHPPHIGLGWASCSEPGRPAREGDPRGQPQSRLDELVVLELLGPPLLSVVTMPRTESCGGC